MNRKQVVDLILASERGINRAEPASVGGISVDGISRVSWQAYKPRVEARLGFMVPRSVEAIAEFSEAERERVTHAFYYLYLDDYRVWALPEFMQYIYADFAVNAGSAAVRIIQSLAGCAVDGIWGSGTSTAVASHYEKVMVLLEHDKSRDNAEIMAFHDAKLRHYERLVRKNPTEYGKWLNGWKRRAGQVLLELSEYFEAEPEPTPSAVDTETDAESDEMARVLKGLREVIADAEHAGLL